MTFTDIFYKHIMFRHSCGKCHFCNTRRPSDITIADFWGWEKTDPSFNADDRGVSLILVNTEKGRRLFEEASKDLTVIQAELADCLQPNLTAPSAIHPDRMRFEQTFAKRGLEYAYNKYCRGERQPGILRRIARKIFRIIPFHR